MHAIATLGYLPSKKFVFTYFNESSLKMMKIAFMLKAFFVLEIFTFLFWHFGYVGKQLDKKATVNFKIYDVTDWTTLSAWILKKNISHNMF